MQILERQNIENKLSEAQRLSEVELNKVRVRNKTSKITFQIHIAFWPVYLLLTVISCFIRFLGYSPSEGVRIVNFGCRKDSEASRKDKICG